MVSRDPSREGPSGSRQSGLETPGAQVANEMKRMLEAARARSEAARAEAEASRVKAVDVERYCELSNIRDSFLASRREAAALRAAAAACGDVCAITRENSDESLAASTVAPSTTASSMLEATECSAAPAEHPAARWHRTWLEAEAANTHQVRTLSFLDEEDDADFLMEDLPPLLDVELSDGGAAGSLAEAHQGQRGDSAAESEEQHGFMTYPRMPLSPVHEHTGSERDFSFS